MKTFIIALIVMAGLAILTYVANKDKCTVEFANETDQTLHFILRPNAVGDQKPIHFEVRPNSSVHLSLGEGWYRMVYRPPDRTYWRGKDIRVNKKFTRAITILNYN